MFTNALLQSHNKAHIPVINTLVCGAAKLLLMYFLTGNPNFGILGVPICSILCYATIAVLNLICIRVLVPERPALVKNLLRSLVPALLMGVIVYFISALMQTRLGISSNLLLCAFPIAIGALVYFVLVAATKAITREDCLLLPKGEKIAKLLKL
jgi:stage V sporulation protein B